MERAIKLLRQSEVGKECLDSERLAIAAWAAAAGRKVADHTRVAGLAGTRLLVDVEDDVWRRQLDPLGPVIAANLEKVLGSRLVTRIEFRVMPKRRGAAREFAPVRAADDADRIADPMLGRIFRADRARRDTSETAPKRETA